jgi:hypothetical protein
VHTKLNKQLVIAKMKSNQSIGATLGYNLKEESQIIDVHNLEGDQLQDYEMQMKLTQQLFVGRAKNLTAHIIISPGIEDGQKLTNKEWKEIANDYLKKTSLEKHEAIVFLHQDREHKHLHIVANRIDSRGAIYRNGNELVMSQRVGNEIAKERGLTQAREIMFERKLLTEQGIESTAIGSLEKIKNDLKMATEKARDDNNLFDQNKYFSALLESGYKVKEHLNKDNGQIRGYGIEKDGIFYNASDIGKEFTLSKLNQNGVTPYLLNQQANQRQQTRQQSSSLRQMSEALKETSNARKRGQELKSIKEDVKKIINNKYYNHKEYFAAVEKLGYQVKEHLNKETGEVRGYGIGKNGIFFNASDIGKEFTLKELGKDNFIKEDASQAIRKDQGQSYQL